MIIVGAENDAIAKARLYQRGERLFLLLEQHRTIRDRKVNVDVGKVPQQRESLFHLRAVVAPTGADVL